MLSAALGPRVYADADFISAMLAVLFYVLGTLIRIIYARKPHPHVCIHSGYIVIASAHGVGSLAAGIILYAVYVHRLLLLVG